MATEASLTRDGPSGTVILVPILESVYPYSHHTGYRFVLFLKSILHIKPLNQRALRDAGNMKAIANASIHKVLYCMIHFIRQLARIMGRQPLISKTVLIYIHWHPLKTASFP